MSGRDFYSTIYKPIVHKYLPIETWQELPGYQQSLFDELSEVFDFAIEQAYLKGKNENSSN